MGTSTTSSSNAVSTPITKAGYLLKESKYLKQYRKRWMVLRGTSFISYKEEFDDNYPAPTEIFDLLEFTKIEEIPILNKFKLISSNSDREFQAQSTVEMRAWANDIKKIQHIYSLNIISEVYLNDNISNISQFAVYNYIDVKDHFCRWYEACIIAYKKPNEPLPNDAKLSDTQQKQIKRLEKLEGIFIHYLGWESKFDEWIFIEPNKTICICHIVCVFDTLKHRIAPHKTQSTYKTKSKNIDDTGGKTKWITLPACPATTETAYASGCDKNTYIIISFDIASEDITKALINNTHQDIKPIINCIYKYNVDLEKWGKIDLSDLEIDGNGAYAMDANKQILYILYDKHLTQIQLKGNAIVSFTTYNHNICTEKTIVLNNELYVFGGKTNNLIFKWDQENKRFTKINTMYNEAKIIGFDFIYVNKTNSLLLFGGMMLNLDAPPEFIENMIEYDINENQWNELQVLLPNKAHMLAAMTMAIRDKYVLILGGYDLLTQPVRYFDDIYIYSLEHKTVRKSKIKCPVKGIFECITVNDYTKDEKTVFGYVKNQWEICEIDNQYIIPSEVLNVIRSFYLVEFVYLFDKHNKTHYKISTLCIV